MDSKIQMRSVARRADRCVRNVSERSRMVRIEVVHCGTADREPDRLRVVAVSTRRWAEPAVVAAASYSTLPLNTVIGPKRQPGNPAPARA